MAEVEGQQPEETTSSGQDLAKELKAIQSEKEVPQSAQSEKPSFSDQRPRLGRRLVAVGVGMLASVSSMVAVEGISEAPAAADSSPTSSLSASAGTTAELASGSVEAQRAPKEMVEYMDKNTVLLDSPMTCSGTLLRNGKNEVVGVITAKHCVTDALAAPGGSVTSANGAVELAAPGGQETKVGKDYNTLKNAGNISEFLVSSDSDVAIGVRHGQKAAEVLKDYNREHLTQKEIDKLVPNKTIINFGTWPIIQKGDSNGYIERQDFSGIYLGQITTANSEGLVERVALVTVDENAANAVCSFGSSGAAGLVELPNREGKPTIYTLGPQSVFAAFIQVGSNYPPALAEKGIIQEELPNAKLKEAVCGFAIKPVSTEYTIVTVNSQSASTEG